MNEAQFMQAALEVARKGIALGQSPFGAVIVQEGTIVSCTHNTVWQDWDPTAHAEVNAIRVAGKALQNIKLNDCEMFTTCEPCPMCLSAIHWSKIRRVIYGASIRDAAEAGFTELTVPAKELARMGGSSLIVENGVLERECRGLFQEWKQAAKGSSY